MALGNILSLAASGFLLGVKSQLQGSFKPKRRVSAKFVYRLHDYDYSFCDFDSVFSCYFDFYNCSNIVLYLVYYFIYTSGGNDCWVCVLAFKRF